MKNFDYYLPKDAGEATEVLKKVKNARIKGGGTDLMGLMKGGITAPTSVLSIGDVKELSGFKLQPDGKLWIGAATTLSELVDSEDLPTLAPAIQEAAAKTATPLVRNKATVGGNLCQRPRCWYFRHPDYNCTKKGGDTCYSAEGENKYHAIFENVTCNIIHPSNLAPALWVHDAHIHVTTAKGKSKHIPLADFWVTPEEDISTEISLDAGDMVTGVSFAPLAPNSGSTYIEVREKQSYDWALTSCASRIDLDGGNVKDCRIVVSAVAPIPLRRKAAEKVIRGQRFTEELAWKAGEVAVADATPLRDNRYKIRMLKANVAHALIAAHTLANGGK